MSNPELEFDDAEMQAHQRTAQTDRDVLRREQIRAEYGDRAQKVKQYAPNRSQRRAQEAARRQAAGKRKHKDED